MENVCCVNHLYIALNTANHHPFSFCFCLTSKVCLPKQQLSGYTDGLAPKDWVENNGWRVFAEKTDYNDECHLQKLSNKTWQFSYKPKLIPWKLIELCNTQNTSIHINFTHFILISVVRLPTQALTWNIFTRPRLQLNNAGYNIILWKIILLFVKFHFHERAYKMIHSSKLEVLTSY